MIRVSDPQDLTCIGLNSKRTADIIVEEIYRDISLNVVPKCGTNIILLCETDESVCEPVEFSDVVFGGHLVRLEC